MSHVTHNTMNCCFCGTVKNCGPYLNKVFENIEKLGTLFDDYMIVVYFDNSNDDSLNIIKQYKEKNPRFMYYHNAKEVSKYRTHRLAHGRNKCIKLVYEKFKCPYFAMIDFDDVCFADVKIDALQKHLHLDTWDALSFNKTDYYDIWALSIQPYLISFRHFHSASRLEDKMKKYVKKLLNRVPPGGLLECHSAFNGFAIYRTCKFVNCYYDGSHRIDLLPMHCNETAIASTKCKLNIQPFGTECSSIEDCEHRSFHIMAMNKNGARIRIAPDILF